MRSACSGCSGATPEAPRLATDDAWARLDRLSSTWIVGQHDDFKIRTMRRDDISFANRPRRQVRDGNPGLRDGEVLPRRGPRGFLIGELRDEPVGCISADFLQRSLRLHRPLHRSSSGIGGLGYGLRLWQGAMARLQGHNVGLDGVVAQQANYARSGFRLAYANVRYRGRAETAAIHPSVAPAERGAVRGDRRSRPEGFFPERRDAFLRVLACAAQRGRVHRERRWSADRVCGGAALSGRMEDWSLGRADAP